MHIIKKLSFLNFNEYYGVTHLTLVATNEKKNVRILVLIHYL